MNTPPLYERLVAIPPALLLAWGGIMKLSDPMAFQLAVLDFQVVSFFTAGVVAAYLPWLEIAVAISLLFRILPFAGISLASSLYLLFVVLLTRAIVSGKNVQCGCLGIASLPAEAMLAIDVTMLLTCLVLWAFEARRQMPSELSHARSPGLSRMDM